MPFSFVRGQGSFLKKHIGLTAIFAAAAAVTVVGVAISAPVVAAGGGIALGVTGVAGGLQFISERLRYGLF